ncbi:MAG: hypothetical protein ABIU09_09890 [Pyrinomonadaceae bacterium]
MKKLQLFISAVVICGIFVISAQAQKRSAKVYLNVTLDNTVAQVGGLRSDGQQYSDGVNGVTASIDEYGWLGLDTGLLGRTITADYSVPINIVTTGLPAIETRRGVFRTFVTSLKFQDMTVGSFQCVGAALTFIYGDIAGTERSSGYRRGDSDTAWVKVYRQNVDTWVLTTGPQSDCGGTSSDGLARVRERKTKGKTTPESIYGTYMMPFAMTLTRKP